MLSDYENDTMLSGHRRVKRPRMVYLGRTKSGARHYRMVEPPKRSLLGRAILGIDRALTEMDPVQFWGIVAFLLLVVAGIEGGAFLG